MVTPVVVGSEASKSTVVRDCGLLDAGVVKSSSSEELSDSEFDELRYTRYMYVTITSMLHTTKDAMSCEEFT